jgi:hypothetical protein
MLTGLYSIRATSELYGVKLCRPATSLGRWLTRSRFLQIFPFGWLFTRYNTQKMVSKTSHIAYIFMYFESRVSVVYHVRVFVCVCWHSLFGDSHDRSYVDSLLSSYLLPVCPCVQLYSCTRMKEILANIWQAGSFTKFLHWGEKKDSRRAGTIPRVVMSSACARRWSPIAAIANPKKKKKKKKNPERPMQSKKDGGKNLSSAM